MKKILLSIALIMLFINCFSQHESNLLSGNDTLRFPKEKNRGKDRFILDLYSDVWKDVPDNVKVRTINQGANFYIMKNHPMGTSNFSFAWGLGFSFHNFYSDGIPTLERDNLNKPTGNTVFETLGTYYQKQVNYSTNKLTITYLDLPLEIKFKTRDGHNRQFKFSFGFKIGYNISNHTKYKGDDVMEGTDDKVVITKSNIKNLSDWNYGVTARIGKGMFSLMGYYSLSKTFDKDKGPQMYPISVGISISPF